VKDVLIQRDDSTPLPLNFALLWSTPLAGSGKHAFVLW
jgi:hypothetical protein